MSENLLIIFVKNPVWGKVKTRLAATIGPDKALEVYHLLLQKTMAITRPLKMDKVVFFSDYLEQGNGWDKEAYQMQVQQGDDLGARMAQAFATGFAWGYRRVGIIGSDCFELTTEMLREAYDLLAKNDLVVGPATDGGYYFLGMTCFRPGLFQNKTWSTPSVLSETLADAEKEQLKTTLLPKLTDVDEAQDLVTIPGYRTT